MGKINTDNYPNRPFASYQDDDMFILQDNGGETYTTNVGDVKNLADSRIKLEGVQVNGSDLPISNKKVNVDISGKTDLRVIAFPFHDPEPDEPQITFLKGAYVTYNGKLYEITEEHTGAWNPSHAREIDVAEMYVRAGNGGYNNGDCATCEGYFTKASGNYSHAEGRETQAVGECTHAEGRGTIANSIYQHVEGKYNVADNESKYIHIIGNGIDDNNRSNAMTLDWDGNLTVSGEVEDGNGEKISDKADKVTNATSGHLAGLDSNGNLTDSGVSPTEEVTLEGNPITFNSPFEQDAKSVIVTVEPIQDLHGYDHPWPAGGGKNKLPLTVDGIKALNTDGTWSGNTYTYNGGTVTILTDGDGNVTGFRLNGTFSAYFQFNITGWIDFSGTYILNGAPGVTGTNLYVNNGDQLYEDFGSGVNFTVAENLVCRMVIDAVTYTNVDVFPMIRLATESDATFAPYSNICPISGIDEVEIGVSDGESEPTTTTIPLPSTLYDADVDVTNGDADNRFGIVDENANWVFTTRSSSYTISSYVTFEDASIKTNGSGMVNFLPINNQGAWNSETPVAQIFFFDGEHGIRIYDNFESLEDFRQKYSGLQFVYELATPTTISFTPAILELLEGTNVITTNGEKVAVTYGRSLWQDIDELKTDTEGKLNKSDVATIEGDTASKAYSVNDFMLRADGLYKVTAPIASGASITSSNTTKTTIGAVLTALLNS